MRDKQATLKQLLSQPDNQCYGFSAAEAAKKKGFILAARFAESAPLVFVRDVRKLNGMLQVQTAEGWAKPYQCFYYRTMVQYMAAIKGTAQ